MGARHPTPPSNLKQLLLKAQSVVASKGFGHLAKKSLQSLIKGEFLGRVQQGMAGQIYYPPYDPNAAYEQWRKNRDQNLGRKRAFLQGLLEKQKHPLISLLLPTKDPDPNLLAETVSSVLNQAYTAWELIIAVAGPIQQDKKDELTKLALQSKAISLHFFGEDSSVAKTANKALELATGEYLARISEGDLLDSIALLSMAETIVSHPEVDMIYSDEDNIDSKGRHHHPFFKPDWSPEYLYSVNYIHQLSLFRTHLAREIGGFRPDFHSAFGYDFTLRFSHQAKSIRHIPDILYHQRSGDSLSQSRKDEIHTESKAALRSHLRELFPKSDVTESSQPGYYSCKFEPSNSPLVSIVIPTASQKYKFDNEEFYLLERCLKSITSKSSYINVEFIVIDNDDMPEDLATAIQPFNCRVLHFTKPFNLSEKMNLGVEAARGEQLVLLNDDIEVQSADWLEWLIGYSQMSDVGAVGGLLFFPTGQIQHSGVLLLNSEPAHGFYGVTGDHPGYFNSHLVPRNYSAVTGACLAVKKDLYEGVGGFDPTFPLNYNDVDFCLKLLKAGYRNLVTPGAKLVHYESISKAGTFQSELEKLKSKWGSSLEKDPFYNSNLSSEHLDFRISSSPNS